MLKITSHLLRNDQSGSVDVSFLLHPHQSPSVSPKLVHFEFTTDVFMYPNQRDSLVAQR